MADKQPSDRLINAMYILGGAWVTVEQSKLAYQWYKDYSTPDIKSKVINRGNNLKLEELDIGNIVGPDALSDVHKIGNSLNEMKQTLAALTSLQKKSHFSKDLASPDFRDLETPNIRTGDIRNQINSAYKRKNTNMAELSLEPKNDGGGGRKRNFSFEMEESDFYKIVFTGGPCAGKTTAISSVADKLREKGYTVFCVPEAATMIFSAGGDLDLRNYTEYEAQKFQYLLMCLQKSLEDIYQELALLNRNKKCVVLCDRGVMDGSAYLSSDQWQTLIDEWGVDVVRMRDRRYDLVLHLVTAADGAAEHYSAKNNTARAEEIELAIALDRKVQQAWMAHPCFVVIDNKADKGFSSKIERTETAVMRYLGLPTSVKFYNKYLIKGSRSALMNELMKHGLAVEEFVIEDTFVKSTETKNVHEYIRKRSGVNSKLSFQKGSKKIEKSENEKYVYTTLKRGISWKEYKSYMALKVKGTDTVKRNRACFLWKDQYFF